VLAVLVVLALLLVAAPARGETWKVPRAPATVALAGDGVVWVQPRRDGADLYVARPGQGARLVEAFRAERSSAFELAASKSRVVVLRRAGEGLDVFAGAVGSRLTRIESCAAPVSHSGVDVDGRVVVFPRCDGRLVVRDLDGTEPDVLLGSRVEDAQMAGRFVAWLERSAPDSPSVVVYDRKRHDVAYAFPAAGVGALTVQGNAKVAFALETGSGELEELGWATSRQPRANPLDVANRFAYYPRMAGGRVAFGRDPVKATDGGGHELGIVAPWSPHAQILSRRLTATTTLDFDGETIAYAERRRHGAAIRTRRPPQPSTGSPSTGSDPASGGSDPVEGG
jgi:hypothetical protein